LLKQALPILMECTYVKLSSDSRLNHIPVALIMDSEDPEEMLTHESGVPITLLPSLLILMC
jgi:hypothetical protein